MNVYTAVPQVCAYFLQNHNTPKLLLLGFQLAYLVFYPPLPPSLSQPAVQINNQALKWRKETSPMTARGKSSSNYTTKHCLSIFCLTVILLSVLLLLTLLLWHSSLLFLLLLNFNQHNKELKKHFPSFVCVMRNTELNSSTLSLFSHHHLFSPFLKISFFYHLLPLLLLHFSPACYHSVAYLPPSSSAW